VAVLRRTPHPQPRPAADELALRGSGSSCPTPEGFVYDMRVATETFRNANGKPTVDIVTDKH
jgi:hypothetical protein